MPTQEQVAAAIIQLRPHLRAAFVMVQVLRRSRYEVAATLGISERRLDRRLTKALSACRARLVSQGIDARDME
jgi:DNA-directed RNA polymerase specialized sigma24 family protein